MGSTNKAIAVEEAPAGMTTNSHNSINSSNLAGDDSSVGMSVGSNNKMMTDTGHTKKKGSGGEDDIAKQESRWIFYSRSTVLLVLIISAIIVSYSVYRYSSTSEKHEFETQFESDASKVLESIGTTMGQTLGATDSFVVQMLVYARNSNSEWPFVTIPGFAIQAAKLLELSKAFFVTLNPVVMPNQKVEWERYANESKGWIEDGLDVQEQDTGYTGPIVREYNASYEIFAYRQPGVDGPGPALGPQHLPFYVPVWQNAPVVPSALPTPYNLDDLSLFGSSMIPDIIETFDKQRVVIGGIRNVLFNESDLHQKMRVERGRDLFLSKYLDEIEVKEPATSITYPIIENADTKVRIDFNEPQTIVGRFRFEILWRHLIRDTLPDNSNGILVVFSESCSGEYAFTYQLDGPTPIFLGAGDLHESKYNHLGLSSNLADLMDETYTGIPISRDYCPKTITVYPSQGMEDRFRTSEPILWTGIAASVFLFTSLVFICYDCLVARRQRIVMNRAIASGAIVSSLFPAQVRAKLYQENKELQERENNQRNFINNDIDPNSASPDTGKNKQIADLFEDTTVMFADLAGFTAWSSSRTPLQVFELLEILYGAFDKIADARRVFKVETIGDCYLCCTGLPEPQADHAVIMARFAGECILKMQQLVQSLTESLGPGTAELQLRVGLNSGPTTAGVLRGQKSRFQLFGDTVNTAARMESLGVPGKIHVSQATADCLIMAGKNSWLETREDLVKAKGKGEMQTYWVLVKPSKGANTVASSRSMFNSEDGTTTTTDPVEWDGIKL